MKALYVVAILMVVLVVGCAKEAPPAEAPPAPPAEAPPAPPAEAPPAVEEAAPAEEAEEPAEEEKEMLQPDQEQIDRLKVACERGAVSLCTVLKNKYDVVAQPITAQETESDDTEGADTID